MKALIIAAGIVVVLLLLGLAKSARIVQQYQDGVLFRFGRIIGERKPGFRLIIPFVDVLPTEVRWRASIGRPDYSASWHLVNLCFTEVRAICFTAHLDRPDLVLPCRSGLPLLRLRAL